MEEIIYKELKKRYFYCGCELSHALIRYPYFADRGKISEFYELMANNAFSWFCDILCENAKKEYDELRAESRVQVRTEKKYRYELSFAVVKNGTDNACLEIEISASLKRGKNEVISEFFDVDVWDENNVIVKIK